MKLFKVIRTTARGVKFATGVGITVGSNMLHGFDGVPEGYEVHHVVPLSEGGADTPDNMILVSEADHAAITSAHAGFYGWRD